MTSLECFYSGITSESVEKTDNFATTEGRKDGGKKKKKREG